MALRTFHFDVLSLSVISQTFLVIVRAIGSLEKRGV